MKTLLYCLVTIFLLLAPLHSAVGQAADESPPFINKVGIGIGLNFPFGSGILEKGAYPFGLSLYVNATHATSRGHNYELLTGVDIMADFGGGIYMAVPVLINRTYELTNFGNSHFSLGAFTGLGYYFHHIFTRTDGVIIKNQHTLGIDGGLTFNYSPGKKWDLNLRSGVFRSFTKPVQVYFNGKTMTSENRFRYATIPVLIGVSRKIGN